jgi:hypothetical protein
MTCKGVKPLIKLVNKTYETGIVPSPEELELCKAFWHPSSELSSWDVTILPRK